MKQENKETDTLKGKQKKYYHKNAKKLIVDDHITSFHFINIKDMII